MGRGDRVALTVQVGGALVLFLGLALAPPARGTLLLLPVGGAASPVRLAIARDALLIGRGPIGSVVVRGDRHALLWPMLRAGVLTLAAPALACGEVPR